RKLASDRLGKRNKAAIARRINRLVAGADTRGVGCDINDAPTTVLYHQWRDHVMSVERTIKIDANNPVPKIAIRLQERHRPIPTGIVYESPDRSDVSLNLRDGRVNGCAIAHIHGVNVNAGFWR